MILQMQLLEFNTSYRKKMTEETKTSRPPTELLTIHGNTYLIHTINTDTYRYIQIHTKYELNFFWSFYLIVWSMYCMYRFKIHAHKYTYCVLFNFYVCMCIYLYVCVCIFCGKTRRRVDTDTYIHIHAHTYKFSKKYIHIKQKYIPYTY